jgi:argininosuccinate lyase
MIGKTLRESAYYQELKPTDFLFEGIGIADMAHVAMLMKTGIIGRNIGKTLLTKLLHFQKIPPSKLKFDPSRGDIYTNREFFLSKQIGNVSNYIHTGRARREAINIAFFIACRERFAHLGLSLGALCKVFLSLARRHKRTYMTDFTYLQHAHPTTLGHYLAGYLYQLMRDLTRLKGVYCRINQSPAGSGSINGSQLPLDRVYLKSLMEFNDVVIHTRDAMWRHDVIIESMLPLLTILTTISRFSEELMIWSTSEFGLVELADSHTRRSVIMPQKKNPYSLAFIRGLARNMIGRFVSITATGHTTSGQPDNRIFAYHDFPECIDETRKAVDLFADVLQKCTFHRDRLYQSANKGFTAATDIIDYFITRYSIDNRTAYAIVSKAIEKISSNQNHSIPYDIFYHAAQDIGITLPKTCDKDFYDNLSIEKLIEKRKGIGGASIKSMDVMLGQCSVELKKMMGYFLRKKPELFKARFYRKIKTLIKEHAE